MVDSPQAPPETWEEKTDFAESADWFNGKYIVTAGSNLNMTRTPDVHFAAEIRDGGGHVPAAGSQGTTEVTINEEHPYA
jgi:nitrate reductase alpha subunit